MIEKISDFLQKRNIIWGPVFLLCTLAMSAQTTTFFALFLLAIAGFYLCARFQLRGCCYALVLLGVTAAVEHAFLVSDHLWQLGIEGSLGLAFFISALVFEENVLLIEGLTQQVQTRTTALENLEDEIAKVKEAHLAEQITISEKMTQLQKELEELQTEHFSILILNEVLRKTTARHIQENESFATLSRDQGRQIDSLKGELESVEKDLMRVSDRGQIMQELNAARLEKEQMHLLLEKATREVEQGRMVHLSQMEPLFKQLKKQFEEKSQILQETRTHLFITDTELQKLRMEQTAAALNPLPKEVDEEFHALGKQVQALEEENQQLQELISVLTSKSG